MSTIYMGSSSNYQALTIPRSTLKHGITWP